MLVCILCVVARTCASMNTYVTLLFSRTTSSNRLTNFNPMRLTLTCLCRYNGQFQRSTMESLSVYVSL